MIEFLKNYFKKLDIVLSDTQAKQFEVYKNMLVEWNKVMNLTGITDDKEVAIKHFADCAVPTKLYDFKNKSVIDIGTGAGFPGLPIKITEPTVKLTLLDSLQKRISFLREVGSKCNIDAEYVHARAEDMGKDEGFRERFDIAVSRAVAPLNILCEYDLPYVKVGGSFIALKGPNAYEEVEACKNALSVLGAELVEIKGIDLPDTDLKHNIVIIKKTASTPEKYPRRAKKIERNPL